MSCEFNDQKIEIFRGEGPTLEISLFEPTLKVFKVVGATKIEVTFFDENGAKIVKTLLNGVTIVDAEAGEITVNLTTSETLTLPVAENQTFYVYIEKPSSGPRIVEFNRVLNVSQGPL